MVFRWGHMKRQNATITVLAGGFVAMILLMVALGIGAKRVNDVLVETTVKLYEHPLTVSNQVLEAYADMVSIHRYMKDVALARNADELDRAVLEVNTTEQRIYGHFAVIEERFLGDKTKIAEVRRAFSDWQPIRNEVIALTRSGKYDEAAAITKGKGAVHVGLLKARMDSLIAFASNKAAEFLAHSDTEYARSQYISNALIVVPVVLGGVIAFFVIVKVSRSERQLRRSEELFAKVFRASPAAISISDLDKGILHDINENWLSVLDYQPDEVVGKTVMELNTWADLSDRGKIIAQLERDGIVRDFDADLRKKDGKIIHTIMAGETISLGGETRAIFAFTDITLRKQAEETVREAKEQAELANRTKTEFLANMSHELRTPIAIINGSASMIAEEMFGPLNNDKYRDYARNIKQAGVHLMGVINDLLDVSRIEMNRLDLDEKPLDVDALLRACFVLVKERAEEEELRITVETADNLPHLRADELRIKQVLLNLLSNAIKFTPPGGRLKLSANVDQNGRIVMSVADTGVGFVVGEGIRAGMALGRQGDPHRREIQGAGIGLPLSRKLVELHGGELDIESQLGVGTVASVRFPVERVV